MAKNYSYYTTMRRAGMRLFFETSAIEATFGRVMRQSAKNDRLDAPIAQLRVGSSLFLPVVR